MEEEAGFKVKAEWQLGFSVINIPLSAAPHFLLSTKNISFLSKEEKDPYYFITASTEEAATVVRGCHLNCVDRVKKNKGKPHSKWTREAMRGKFSHTYHPLRLNFTHTSKITLHTPAGGRVPPCPTITQPIRRRHNPKLSLSSNKLLFKTPPSTFSCSLSKHAPLLCSLDLPVCKSYIAMLLPFANKLNLPG